MLPRCPNPHCSSPQPRKNGTFYRVSDAKAVQRWLCKSCQRHFSAATFQAAYRQHKRRANPEVAQLLCSGVSQRRIALLLRLHRITVARKLAFLAHAAEQRQAQWLEGLPKVRAVQFDDLITLEHTKCKPLAISLAVEEGTRRILGFEVSSLPASGHLAALSKRKYGVRPNQRPRGLQRLFESIRIALDANVSFRSDADPLYPVLVRRNFPGAAHHRSLGGRGCVTGQGELKQLRYDPLFSLNHTCAMLRANINRLFRRTWCTTKKAARLRQHVAVYVDFHNTVLLNA
jgi:transposase-like protein